jgi:hypothetical protein
VSTGFSFLSEAKDVAKKTLDFALYSEAYFTNVPVKFYLLFVIWHKI